MRVKPRRLRTGTYIKTERTQELPASPPPHTLLHPSTYMFKAKMNGRGSVCIFFIRRHSVPFICQRTNAGEGWEKKGFYCEMDASFNGLESEAERERERLHEEGRCREKREEALMESSVSQSSSGPNNSNGLFITTNFALLPRRF